MAQEEKKKKSLNANIILFVFALLFLAAGFCGGLLQQIRSSLFQLKAGIANGDKDSISVFITQIEDLTAKKLRYHDVLLDLDSLKENLLGTRVVMTEDATVVKTSSGRLIDPYKELKESSIQTRADDVQHLYDLAEKTGARFLCCSVPWGGVYEETPSNIPNYDQAHYDAFADVLMERGVPCLGMKEALLYQGVRDNDVFFRTDHHMTPETGFAASRAICLELNKRYGFPVDVEASTLDNYTVDKKKDLFLGSYGKKAGRLFTWEGAEDFSVIVPSFQTDFTETVAGREEVRTGPFEQTMLYPQYLAKDYYHLNNYCFYSGGDFNLQVIKNNRKPDGAKIVVIRNSFACVVTPFLALQAGELHVIDERDEEYVFGSPVNIETYLQKVKPDYVLVLKAF